MTLLLTGPDSILLRLSHQFGLHESALYSIPATVNISAMFIAFPSVVSVQELSLTGNQPKADLNQNRASNGAWRVEGEASEAQRHSWRDPLSVPDPSVVTLGPLEVKTFRVVFAAEISNNIFL